MSRGERRVAGSGFRSGGADQTRFRGLLHAASVSAGRLDATSRITHRQRRLLFTIQHILVSILPLPCGAMLRTKLFPEALQHDREYWNVKSGQETHGRSQVVLCVVGGHGLWLGRIGSISEEGGGTDHGVWESDGVQLCISQVQS